MEREDIQEVGTYGQTNKRHVDSEADHKKLSKEKGNNLSTTENQKNDYIVIDIAQELKLDLNKCVIHRVPRLLRKVNEIAYTPQLVSVGPFHHGRQELQAMEFHKQKYYEEFCKRAMNINGEDIDLKSFIEENSNEILGSYAPGTFQLEKQVFEDIILRDACFIIELFLRKLGRCDDFILKTTWLFSAIVNDLLLLENQIPFFLLKKLYDRVDCSSEFQIPAQKLKEKKDNSTNSFCNNPLKTLKELLFANWRRRREYITDKITGDHDHPIHPFLKLTCIFFSRCFSGMTEKEVFNHNEIKHFTDLLRQSMFPKDWNDNEPKRTDYKIDHPYNATTLDEAGVNFEVRKEARLADIKTSPPLLKYVPGFSSMQLQLPQFVIADSTERRLRNVMALEQCLYRRKLHVCNYVSLMDDLINTKEDVNLLVKKKIINNYLGSDEAVVDLFNKLGDQIFTTIDISHQALICKELTEYCDNWWHAARATLKRVYFKDLWTGSSTIVGVFVLIFSVSSPIKFLFFS